MSFKYPSIKNVYRRDNSTYKLIPGEYGREVFEVIGKWRFTEKVDGTNIRIMWSPDAPDQLKFGGRTNAAQLPMDLVQHLESITDPAEFAKKFNSPVTIYGEGYGAGIQKVGWLYSSVKKFIAFDVLIDNQWWMSPDNTYEICTSLGLPVVPEANDIHTLREAVEIVRQGFKSRVAETEQGCIAEGVVGVPAVPLFEANGDRIVVKIKHCDFKDLDVTNLYYETAEV